MLPSFRPTGTPQPTSGKQWELVRILVRIMDDAQLYDTQSKTGKYWLLTLTLAKARTSFLRNCIVFKPKLKILNANPNPSESHEVLLAYCTIYNPKTGKYCLLTVTIGRARTSFLRNCMVYTPKLENTDCQTLTITRATIPNWKYWIANPNPSESHEVLLAAYCTIYNPTTGKYCLLTVTLGRARTSFLRA